jgi:hypothetical protein
MIKTFENNENNESFDINNKVKRKRLQIDKSNIENKFDNEEDESRITFNDKTFLDLKQENLAKNFLLKHANNDNLYIFPNNYEPEGKRTFILLNLPEDKESFQEFIDYNYTSAQSNLHGILDFSNFKVYYTNTLQTVTQIVDEVTAVFINSGFTAVKMQLRFGVIWEGPTVESNNIELISQYTSMDSSSSSSSSSSVINEFETRRRYYPQNVYQTNFNKYPLLLVTYKTYMRDIKPFIFNQLKDLQNKHSDNGESKHRIVAVFNLQCFLYDVGKPIGGKLGMKSLVFDFVKNRFASTVTEYSLCWFACISYLTHPKKGRECLLLKIVSFTSMVIRTYLKKRKN